MEDGGERGGRGRRGGHGVYGQMGTDEAIGRTGRRANGGGKGADSLTDGQADGRTRRLGAEQARSGVRVGGPWFKRHHSSYPFHSWAPSPLASSKRVITPQPKKTQNSLLNWLKTI